MHNFISEDDIEKAILQKLEEEPFRYNILRCDPSPNKREALADGTGRDSKKQCVLPFVLRDALTCLNPDIPQDKLEDIAHHLCRDFSALDMIATNCDHYHLIRNGKMITIRLNGRDDTKFVKLVDFDHPEKNTFTAVSQMWIQGHVYWRRPDILIFINGLPMVFIELKNSIVKVEEAYGNNLKNYLKDIPNLFAFNQICVLSNGLETRLGAFNAPYTHFFEWLRVDSEKERPDRKAIHAATTVGESSVRYFIDGLLRKDRLLDYIENFILFRDKKNKIIAKNHQYFGVNNLMKSMENRAELEGKLGVFWHTQGSGKSYSMVFFVRKVRKKISGNFTFLIITDREDLDDQIHKNFVKTGVIGQKEECQPKDAKQLREYLQSNKTFIFTLIHKFRYDKSQAYPVLSTRDDIIVLVDEAHRTQSKDLAANMRTALPNANYIAFTGTPLLGSKRLTNQWFGNYVSEYTFAQSVEDGSTVPLFYSRRVSEVGLENDFLDDDVVDIIEDENLNDDEVRHLENSSSRILEVIKREDRLDKIAQDIAYHFPRRGFLGKGMVVSVDKFTTVKMYNKVQQYWLKEKHKIMHERNDAKTKEERDELTKILNYMNRVEMAVIVSEEADENEKFQKQGLDISVHRQKMNEITPEGADIEDRFKDHDDPLQLVFVCAMWLTGFDVENLSTLYLDKPMKGHTLMQAIARANRVYPGKACGFIIDYVNVFKYMQKALTDYAEGDDGMEYPAKDMPKLIAMIENAVDEADKFLLGIGVDIGEIVAESSTFDQLDKLRDAYNNIIANDENKEKFKVILNTLISLYEASRPEIFATNWSNVKLGSLSYLYGLFNHTIDDEKIDRARLRMAQVLDTSVTSQQAVDNDKGFAIHQGKVIDLSKIDVEELKKEIKVTPYKAIEIDDLKAFIEQALQQMLNRNCMRQKFSQRFRNIIDCYNAGGTENEAYYEQLLILIEELKAEEKRPEAEGLSEEELEIFDMLVAGKKLTKDDEQKVKLSAKNLFQKLSEKKAELMVVDWYRDEQPRAKVKSAIEESLNTDLPMSYDKETFAAKTALLLDHFVDMAVQGYGWVAA